MCLARARWLATSSERGTNLNERASCHARAWYTIVADVTVLPVPGGPWIRLSGWVITRATASACREGAADVRQGTKQHGRARKRVACGAAGDDARLGVVSSAPRPPPPTHTHAQTHTNTPTHSHKSRLGVVELWQPGGAELLGLHHLERLVLDRVPQNPAVRVRGGGRGCGRERAHKGEGARVRPAHAARGQQQLPCTITPPHTSHPPSPPHLWYR